MLSRALLRVGDFKRDEAAGLSENMAVNNNVGQPVKLVPEAVPLFKKNSSVELTESA